MPITHKIGAAVRQVVPVIEGTVVDQKIIDGEVKFCVEYSGADGAPHQRYFGEDEIEAVGDSEATA
ncbi:MAG: hypothetical protein U1A73_27260 [Pseudomonas sp.]|nr:hypothetical protein [Pseudomonas sp.]